VVNVLFWQLIEPHTDEFILKCNVNLANVIANQTESDICGGGLQQVFQRMLGVACHVIHFVQNDEFETLVKQIECFHKGMNLIAYNVYSAFVGRVEVNDVALVGSSVMFGLEFVDQVDDGGGFASPRRAIKEQVGKVLLVDNLLEQVAVRGVENNVIELCRSIFLDPRLCLFSFGRRRRHCNNS
jgi:hypothetical protein